jgi:hypothetical protein
LTIVSISPDTKDWTWVLERPCEECGFDASLVRREEIGDVIRGGARQWVAVLSRNEVAERSRPDRWSDLEYACHVRDVYRIFDRRLALMTDVENPLFENWDQDATALTERYDQQVPSVVREELLDAASSYAQRLDSITADQWSRPGRRSNGSLFTVESLSLYALHDPHHHLWDVGVSV